MFVEMPLWVYLHVFGTNIYSKLMGFLYYNFGVFSCSGLLNWCTCLNFQGFFGVYDGHGGKKAAEFVADSLHKNLLEMVDNCVGNIAREEAVKSAYLKTDKEFLQQVNFGCTMLLLKAAVWVFISFFL